VTTAAPQVSSPVVSGIVQVANDDFRDGAERSST